MLKSFIATVWDYYHAHGRHDLPWRLDTSPYSIFISEVMLQQTQAGRVIPKYRQFMSVFSGFEALANAPLGRVLQQWSGLGYNRRAKFLKSSAEAIVVQHDGAPPNSIDELIQLPGIGYNTAAAIVTYAFDRPAVFIETNIRSVFIHHFFQAPSLAVKIDDTEILPLIEQTLDRENPREWYWALMDYGSYLKTQLPNPSRASKYHVRQSRFEGSLRQIRGQVIRALLEGPRAEAALSETITDERLPTVLRQLEAEGMVIASGATYRLP